MTIPMNRLKMRNDANDEVEDVPARAEEAARAEAGRAEAMRSSTTNAPRITSLAVWSSSPIARAIES
jgi:hypothetical protein